MTVVDLSPDRCEIGDAFDHLTAELEWLDLVLTRGVLRMRQVPDGDVHISDAEADELLAGPPDPGVDTRALDERITAVRDRVDAYVVRARADGTVLPLAELSDRSGLGTAERHALLVCLAPELDRKYDRLYAYLQDDITRMRPSVELVTTLLTDGPAERWRTRRLFSAHAPLRRRGLLEVAEDPYGTSGSSGLARTLRVAPRVVAHLLGDDQPDDVLDGFARRVPTAPIAPDDDERQAAAVLDAHDPSEPLVVHLHGADAGAAAEQARRLATRGGRPAVELDVTAVAGRGADAGALLAAALRESWLLDSPAVLLAAEPMFDGAGLDTALDAALDRHPGVVLVVSREPWPASRRPRAVAVHDVELAAPTASARRDTWVESLAAAGTGTADGLADELADRYRLTAGQIRDTAAEVNRATVSGPPDAADWYAACRRASGRTLATVAELITPIHGWDDLVLDARRQDTLRALRDQVGQRRRVLDEWGLGQRIVGSRGLSALFVGPPGTGKTMAAGVLAADLGLELYRVDLSQVVSKYIGETEKNLSRIFAEADGANAILMFDEADALFGKRTDVADAHDRYANIEVSYLLQRMEQHEGIAVLASNLRQNIDDAFLRRLRFVVEFPFPEPAQRLRIWHAHLATGAPLADGLDPTVLAERLPVSGGTIRNIVLSASFLAAADGGCVGMDHLLHAARRELAKSGAVWPTGLDGDR